MQHAPDVSRRGTPAQGGSLEAPSPLFASLRSAQDAAGVVTSQLELGEQELLAATEREVYQQGVRRAVSKDIQKMLKSTKAYVKHVKGPPVMSKATMDKLSVPQATRMHAEHQLCLEQGLKDHISYAEYKANKLQQQHSREEAQQHHRQLEADTRNQNLAAYRAAKQQREQEEAERKSREEAALQQYRRAMACYVRQQAEAELKVHKEKVEKVHKDAAARHARALSANFHV